MKQVKIVWKKELKNCVPFFIFVDGQEMGIIKRGEEFVLQLSNENAEIYFVPKAPRWFGWKALKLQVNVPGNFAELHTGVVVPNDSVNLSLMPKALRDAGNINNQFHCTNALGMEVISMEYVKKYR